jgi:hypothetical protein
VSVLFRARPFVSGTTAAVNEVGGNQTAGSQRRNEMKVNSISGFTCYVEELAKTAEFYEAIGFRAGKQALVSSRR